MIKTTGTITATTYSPSRDVVILTVRPEELFDFSEGQFMMLEAEIDGEMIMRAYSIYSTDQQLGDDGTVSFCIKRKESGVFSTRATQQATIGTKLKLTWPVWRFTDDEKSMHYLFISVGSGLSPCYSIYQSLLHSGRYDKIANIFGERYSSHIPEEVLDAFSLQTEKISNQIFLSREEENVEFKIQNSKFVKGYVQDGLSSALTFLWLLENDKVPSHQNTNITVFVCGLPAMCDDVRDKLIDYGIARERLIIEKY